MTSTQKTNEELATGHADGTYSTEQSNRYANGCVVFPMDRSEAETKRAVNEVAIPNCFIGKFQSRSSCGRHLRSPAKRSCRLNFSLVCSPSRNSSLPCPAIMGWIPIGCRRYLRRRSRVYIQSI